MAPDAQRAKEGPWRQAFVSYAHLDRVFAAQLIETLRERGHAVWFDKEIPETERWGEQLKRAIRNSDNFLVLLSPAFVASPYCALETAYAAGFAKRFIVVRIADFAPPSLHPAIHFEPERELPDPRDPAALALATLSSVQWIDIRRADDPEKLEKISYWLDRTPAEERRRTELLEAARVRKEEGGALLRGRDLGRALGWLAGADRFLRAIHAREPLVPAPGSSTWERERIDLLRQSVDRIREYVTASRRAALRRRCAAGAGALVGAALLALGWLALTTWVSRQAAGRAEALAGDRPAEALALARAATHRSLVVAPTAEARSTLRRVLAAPQLQVLDHRDEAVLDAAFDPSGELVATAHGNRVTVWRWRRRERAQDDIRAAAPVTSVAFGPTPSRLVFSSEDATARVWVGPPGRLHEVARLVHPKWVQRAQFVADDRVLTTADDRTARLWRVEIDAAGSARLEAPERLFRHAERELRFAGQVKDIVFTLGGTSVMAWRAADRREPAPVRLLEPGDYVLDASLLGAWLVAGTSRGSILVQDLELDVPIVHRSAGTAGSIEAVAAHPGRRLIAYERGGKIHLAGLREAGELQDLARFEQHRSSVKSLEFSADGARLVSASTDGTARVWRVTAENFLGEGLGVLEVDFGREVSAVAFDPSGRLLAGGDGLGGVEVLEAETGRRVARYAEPGGAIASLAFDPAGARLLVANEEGSATLIDPRSGRILGSRLEHPPGADACLLQSAAFTADADHVLSLRGSSVMLASPGPSLDGGASRTLDDEGEVLAAAVLPSGDVAVVTRCGLALWPADDGERSVVQRVAVAEDGCECGECCKEGIVDAAIDAARGRAVFATATAVSLWDAARGRDSSVLPLAGPKAGWQRVALSPDGSRAALADERSVEVWDLRPAKPRRAATAPAAGALHVAFSADSELFATAAADGAVQVWSSGQGDLVTELAPGGAPVRAIAFAPEGGFVAVAGDDRRLRVYRRELFAPWAEVERLAEARASYELDDEDRVRTCLAPWSLECLVRFARDVAGR